MSEELKKIQVFTGSNIKVIAMLVMLIDHIGSAILWYTAKTASEIDVYHMVRNVGRIAFPIFCFLLVEGFLHTHDVKKYIVRLAIFAVASEIPFDLAITKPGKSYFAHQNVFWTLLIALLVLIALRYVETKIPAGSTWQGILMAATITAGCLLAYYMKTDYDYKGVIAICVMYFLRLDRIWQVIAGALCFCWEPWAICAFVPILLYNGKRGSLVKYIFYLFYPLHLMILYVIAHFVMQLH